MTILIDLTVILVLIAGIWLFRTPRRAKFGNLAAAVALSCAVVLVLYRNGIMDVGTVAASLLAGAVAGYAVARAVGMIQIPAMVAFQNGAGGAAALLVSLVELTRVGQALDLVSAVSGVLGLAVGAVTFTGSMIASAKLGGKMRQAPQILPNHDGLVLIAGAALVIAGIASLYASGSAALFLHLVGIALAAALGILFAMRVGGADMPVLISFLNAMTGVAAALCGMVIGNQLLIAFGATVAASGSVLTHLMCKAMNRHIIRVFWPYSTDETAKPETSAGSRASTGDPGTACPAPPDSVQGFAKAMDLIKSARKVVIIPGYGMALAKAHQSVAALANAMTALGKDVVYAIHPVAGRMPGHMNVLLAEADVDYDMMSEMDEVNPELHTADLVLVIGACDVVNPAAMDVEGTPISGMPILMAHKAGAVVCCNLDKRPGYSGVENPLYEMDHAILLPGDADKTVSGLLAGLTEETSEKATAEIPVSDTPAGAANALASAEKVIIIPGYGMALSQAQFKAVELASLLTKRGAAATYAIHPVAGRMPGHMNVILAEAEAAYDDLIEMDEANRRFPDTDVALVVGACDVVNPAAIEREGTPISGMPILMAHEAGTIIVCNLDAKPGYSGVPNPLYENPKTIMMPGDARASLAHLISSLQSRDDGP